jgi:HD-GYP domain-containing protein (c-di-GMP phosphodiesterase class II)
MQMENVLASREVLWIPTDLATAEQPGNPRKHMAIPPGAIIPGTLPQFKIYVLTANGQRVLWATDGNAVTPAQLAKLSEAGQKSVFIDLDEEIKYEEYLDRHLGRILENDGLTEEQKASVFSKVSVNVVKGAFETSLKLGVMGEDALRRTQTMIENALIFIAESRSLEALATMIGHDYQTYEHAMKVLWFTVAFLRDSEDIMEAIQPGYREMDEDGKAETLKTCGVAALLHDIGKVFISPDILCKAGPLDHVEWEIMKRHPLTGLAMLTDADLPSFVKKTMVQHHEDFYGGGYPLGLQGENITTLSRVVRVVDTFEAMTSKRPYKDALPPYKAVKIMVGNPIDKKNGTDDRDRGMEKCFDPKILRKFIVFLGHAHLSL